MTWSTPQSVPTPPTQPTAPPGPLTLGDLFSSTIATYKQGWKLFLPLACIPIAIYFALFLILTGIAVVVFMQVMGSFTRTMDPGAVVGPVIGAAALAIVAVVAVSIFCYVFVARLMLASLDYATGRDVPTWATLAQRTNGLMGRLVALAAIGAGVILGVYVVFALIIAAAILGAGRNNSGAAGFIIFLATLALVTVAVWVSVKVTYTLVVMAEERLPAVAALKRSFALTKGAFWRTLGYQLIIGIVVGMITSIPQGMFSTGVQNSTQGGDIGFSGVFGALLVLVLNIALTPVSYIWLSLMYLGRTREVANLAAGYSAGGYGYSTAWHDSGQPFGQTPGQYDQPFGQAPGQYDQPFGQAPGQYGQGGYPPPSGTAYPSGNGYGTTATPPYQGGGQQPYPQPGAPQPYQGGGQQPYPQPGGQPYQPGGQSYPSSAQPDPFAGQAPYGGSGAAPTPSTGDEPFSPPTPPAPQADPSGPRPGQQPPAEGDYFGRPQN